MRMLRSGKVRLANHSRGSRGAAALEFALVLPILLLVLGGIVDYARAYMELQIMTNAASEGARMAIISTDLSVTNDTVEDLVLGFFPGTIDPGDLEIDVQPDPLAEAPRGEIVTVKITRTFTPIFLGFFQWFDTRIGLLPESLTYTASGVRM